LENDIRKIRTNKDIYKQKYYHYAKQINLSAIKAIKALGVKLIGIEFI
jgi:kynurenine formamidase